MIVLLLSILLLMFVVGRYRRSLPDYKRDNFLYVLSALKDGDETPDPGREWIPIDK